MNASPVPSADAISRPLPGAKLRVLSLGAGVQSSTLALLAARGAISPMPDCAIFADTGAEPQGVYNYLEALRAQLPFPVHVVSAGDLRQELLDAAAGKRGAWGRPPLFVRNPDGSIGMTRRQCTQHYKIEPIRKKVRDLIGLKPRQHSPKRPVVEQWIGISTDEIYRLKRSWDRFIENRWPLIELGMSRRDCLRWLEERQIPLPAKSACTFCPYHSDTMWRDIRDHDPVSWEDACAVDESLRTGRHILLVGEPYLHRSAKPLREVDLRTADDRGQPDLFGFMNECEGTCGL